MNRSTRHGTRRGGFTLLEVVLALGIFFAAIAALSHLMWTGTRAGLQGQLRHEGLLRCETKLNELVAGAEVLQAHGETPFPDDANWTWSSNVTSSNYAELLQVEVAVSHKGNSSLAATTVRLSRWVRDPQLFVDAASAKAAEAESDTTSSLLGTPR